MYNGDQKEQCSAQLPPCHACPQESRHFIECPRLQGWWTLIQFISHCSRRRQEMLFQHGVQLLKWILLRCQPWVRCYIGKHPKPWKIPSLDHDRWVGIFLSYCWLPLEPPSCLLDLMHQQQFSKAKAEILQLASCQAIAQGAFFLWLYKKCRKSPSKFIAHDLFSSPFMHAKS